MAEPPHDASHRPSAPLGALAIGALGVVFGDIGTSPLYTLQVGIAPSPGAAPAPEDVLGVVSLIVWALTLVVTIKYLGFVMRADNRGEGGILALLALVPVASPSSRRVRIGVVTLLAIAGAALLYGDGIITPAISVLSALEGVEIAAPGLGRVVVPLTCVVLLGLFAVQSHGTAGIGKVFGPVMVVWFTTIGVLGAVHVARTPAILSALSPLHGVSYFQRHGWPGFSILGVVVLSVTGGEALYADMGHFGARPIRVSWLTLVFPALILCYMGQGALVIRDVRAAANPFFSMVPPGAATYALVALATAATIIASQALITGVFSLTHQAVQLGLLPRVTVRHTSGSAEGQIYLPEVNFALCALCIALVVAFRESSALAAAFGIAVSGTMGITSYLFFVVARRTWGWPLWKTLPPVAAFLAIDTAFFVANVPKFFAGGWVPILVGAVMFAVMADWKFGRAVLAERIAESSPPLAAFIAEVDTLCQARVTGTSIFLASGATGTPPVLYQHAKRIHVLSESVAIITLVTEHVPYVAAADRVHTESLGKGLWRVVARTGFMERPNVPHLLTIAGLPFDVTDPTYYIGRETFVGGSGGEMGVVSEKLFAFLTRNAKSATTWFGIPPEQVIELGTQMDL